MEKPDKTKSSNSENVISSVARKWHAMKANTAYEIMAAC